MNKLDEDLNSLSKDKLIEQIQILRAGIRRHRDSSLHDLCWYHPELWSLLPEKIEPEIVVPEWPQFMGGCIKFRQSLDTQKPDSKRSKEEFKG